MSMRQTIDHICFGGVVLIVAVISFYPPLLLDVHINFLYGFLLVALALVVADRGIRIFKKTDIPLWLFCAAMSLNLCVARDKSLALQSFIRITVILICIYYLTAETVNSVRRMNILTYTICFFAAVSAAGGILDTVRRSWAAILLPHSHFSYMRSGHGKKGPRRRPVLYSPA